MVLRSRYSEVIAIPGARTFQRRVGCGYGNAMLPVGRLFGLKYVLLEMYSTVARSHSASARQWRNASETFVEALRVSSPRRSGVARSKEERRRRRRRNHRMKI